MSISAFDASADAAQPVELYLFQWGTDPSARAFYNDSDVPVVYDGDRYEPLPISRGRIAAQQGLDKSEMTVQLPVDSEIAELFRVYPGSNVVTLRIRYGHLADVSSDFPVVWTGRVQQCKRGTRNPRQAELSCVPSSTSMRRPGLRRHYQLTCPHVLYDDGFGSCKADKAAATRATTVAATGYTEITLASGWNGTPPGEKYIGGLLEWDGAAGRERRTILRVAGDVLSLSAPVDELAVSDDVDVVLGCNHQTDDCADLHSNIVNYGGMPYIPVENPISTNPFK